MLFPRRELLASAGAAALTTWRDRPSLAVAAPAITIPGARKPAAFDLLVVADDDSRDAPTRKGVKSSFLGRVTLVQDASRPGYRLQSQDIDSNLIPLETPFTSGGRGAELSDLLLLPGTNTLLAFDDRTGIVFDVQPLDCELKGQLASSDVLCSWGTWAGQGPVAGPTSLVPRWVLAAGDGNTAQGFKCEWSTCKNGQLYVGSHGYDLRGGVPISSGACAAPAPSQPQLPPEPGRTDPAVSGGGGGVVVQGSSSQRVNSSASSLAWVKVVDLRTGGVTHVDWTERYNAIREAVAVPAGGYVTHEACAWSDAQQRWYWLPRRVSPLPWAPLEDQYRGANVLISCGEDGGDVAVVQVAGSTDPLRGYAAMRFVPGTQQTHIVALKTVERTPPGPQPFESYITVLDITGQVLLPETLISARCKFEGLEILPACTV